MSKKTDKKFSKSLSTSTFISFSSVTASSVLLSEPSVNEPQPQDNILPVYSGTDHEFTVTARKLLKKDPVTRLKALQEMRVILEVSDL